MPPPPAWGSTSRSPLHCRFCPVPKTPLPELSARVWRRIISDFVWTGQKCGLVGCWQVSDCVALLRAVDAQQRISN